MICKDDSGDAGRSPKAGPVIPLYEWMRKGDYRLARPVPSTACLSASLILCAKMNHRILVGPSMNI